MREHALRLVVTSMLMAPAWASTWIVDDNGGPGVDFTSISAAVTAAAPGDVILVRPGTYSGFTLTSGVRVLGDAGVQVTGLIAIMHVGSGPRATIARMTTRGILVSDCTASVTIEDIVARAGGSEVVALGLHAAVAIVASTDVRLRAVDAASVASSGFAERALTIDASRVEITHSHLQGATGLDWPSTSDGGNGITVQGTSDVHVSLSTVLGGPGGDVDGDFSLPPGNGGAGIVVTDSSARLLVTGLPADHIAGAHGGLLLISGDCLHDGHPGSGILLSGASARLSGATIEGASYSGCSIPPPAPAVVGAYTSPFPADPSLSVSGTIAQGQPIMLTLNGAPGSAARLRLGRQLVVQDLPGVYEDRLTVPLRTYDLGTLPPSGQATFQILLSSALAPGTIVVAQGVSITPAETTLTQSVAITVH
jgi:hypothetical protein